MKPRPHTRRRPPYSLAPLLAAWVALALVACTQPKARDSTPVERPNDRRTASARARLAAEADTGELGSALQTALESPDPELRATALWAALPLARTLGPEPFLRATLSPHAEVRRAGAEAFPSLHATRGAVLSRALAAESDPAQIGRLLIALGRTPGAPMATFEAGLARPEPEVQQGACLGLATSRADASDLPLAGIARLMGSQLDGPAPLRPTSVRVACTHALAQLPAPSDPDAARALAQDLAQRLGDPEPEVRLLAARALRRYPASQAEALHDALDDVDWRVAAAAYAAHAVHADAEAHSDALWQRLSQVRSRPNWLDGPHLRVWEHALRTSARLRSSRSRLQQADREFEAMASELLPDHPAAPLAAAHCELAAWVDTQRHWPGRLRACGDGFAPPALVYFHEARLVARQPSTPALRAHYLARMLARGPEAVAAVMAGAGLVRHAMLLPAVRDAAEHGTDADLGRAARASLELVPVLEDADRTTLAALLEARLSRLPPGAATPTLVALLEAIASLDSSQPAQGSLALATHPSPDVAAAARRRMAPVMDADELPPRPTPDGISPGSLEGPVRRLSLALPTGVVQIDLRPELAPAAVVRLVAALEGGWLASAPVHPHAVPPEVVVGDPYASAPGDAPLWLRPHPTPGPCEAGAVLLEPASETSDTLALRVLLSRRPELDGVATRVGQVRSGMRALSSAVYGQVVSDVRVE